MAMVPEHGYKRPREEEDDEDSNYSDEGTTTLLRRRRRRRRRRPCRVSISPATMTHVNLEEPRSEHEKTLSWYQPNEFLQTRMSVRDTCRSFRNTLRYNDCLSHVYDTACQLASSSSDEDSDSDTEPNINNNKPFLQKIPEPFGPWLMPQDVRGLERYSSPLHAMRRAQHLKEVYHIVLRLQACCAADLLAQKARQASSRARWFAALLGQADAWAAAQQ